MEINEYQSAVRDFIKYPTQLGVFYNSLDMMSAIGALSSKINALLESNVEIDRKQALRLGISLSDIMFALANMASDLGLSMDEILALNLKKLSLESQQKIKEQNANPKKYKDNVK